MKFCIKIIFVDKKMEGRIVFCHIRCPGGEIGRHARLRIWCCKVCRFESYPGHILKTFNAILLTAQKDLKRTEFKLPAIKLSLKE